MQLEWWGTQPLLDGLKKIPNLLQSQVVGMQKRCPLLALALTAITSDLVKLSLTYEWISMKLKKSQLMRESLLFILGIAFIF